MESEHILFEIPCGLCYFTQFEHKLGTLLLGEWDGFKKTLLSTFLRSLKLKRVYLICCPINRTFMVS